MLAGREGGENGERCGRGWNWKDLWGFWGGGGNENGKVGNGAFIKDLRKLREVLGFLSSAAGAKGVFVDGKEVGDWAPMGAWYEEVRAEDGTQAVTVRVFQALRGAEDGEADGPFLVEDGCVWRVDHTFYWAVGEVPEVPAGSSGVSYALQGLRRDDETGLYDCVLVRRERVPVEVGPWASHLDVYRERETALLLGVRDDGEGSVDEKVAGFLGEHDLPLAAGDGKVLDVGKRKNEDCTTDVTVEVTAEVGVPEAAVVVAEDAFARRVSVTDRAQETEAGAPTLGGEARSERTAGGRFDNVMVTVTPKEVPEAAVEGTRTLYEVEERVEDRNVTPPPEGGAATAGGAGDVPADVDGVEYPGDYAGNDPASVDGEPVMIETSYIPAGRVPGLEKKDLEHQSLFAVLEEDYGVIPREGDEKIGITYATDEEAALMGVEPESPLFWIVSTTYDQGGQMMEYCRAAARPDRLRITTVMERKLEGAITEYEA